jgi:positive regulator of sigma E activity
LLDRSLPRLRATVCAGWPHASCGPSLREKLIDVSRRLSKSTLSLQVRAGRGDSITLGIEDRDLITVIALVVKYKLVSVIAMCAGCHLDLLDET